MDQHGGVGLGDGLVGHQISSGSAQLEPRILTMIALAGATSFFVGNAFQAQMPEYANYLGADETGTRV